MKFSKLIKFAFLPSFSKAFAKEKISCSLAPLITKSNKIGSNLSSFNFSKEKINSKNVCGYVVRPNNCGWPYGCFSPANLS